MLGGKLETMKGVRSLVDVEVEQAVKSWRGTGAREQDDPRPRGWSREHGARGTAAQWG